MMIPHMTSPVPILDPPLLSRDFHRSEPHDLWAPPESGPLDRRTEMAL